MNSSFTQRIGNQILRTNCLKLLVSLLVILLNPSFLWAQGSCVVTKYHGGGYSTTISGEIGKVSISSTTYHLVKDTFNCSYRGKVYAKKLGEVDMYFADEEISTS